MKKVKNIVATASIVLALLGLALTALPQTGGSQPRFTNVQVTEADSITLTLSGEPSTAYAIQATTDLTKSFSDIGVVRTDVSGKATFTDLGALLLFPVRFYRAQQAL